MAVMIGKLCGAHLSRCPIHICLHVRMDEPAGHQAAAIANRKPGGDVTVVQVPRAGHHCYLDNPEKFDQIVIDFINRPPRKQSLK